MPKQGEIPGTEREVNKRVENAGDLLVSATKKYTKSGNDKKEKELNLLRVMKEEDVAEYTSEELGKTFRIDLTEKVKVDAWNPPKPAKALDA